MNYNTEINYKEDFIVKAGGILKTVHVTDIAKFYTESKVTYLATRRADIFMTPYNLDSLSELLNPLLFYRVNKQYIIAYDSIAEIVMYKESRCFIKLKPPFLNLPEVSAAGLKGFNEWLKLKRQM
jgi:two-component system response regulator LytT